MKPKSLSASALRVAQLCLARYVAENIDYARGINNPAALLGTSVHGALEMFVKACYIEKSQQPSLQLLLDLFQMSYMTTLGTADLSGEDYSDGVEMLKAWFKRTDFSTFTVISSEVKESFPMPTSVGDIPFNYIWDRHDLLGEDEVRVVDYKTNRWGYSPDELRTLIQARVYGVAAQIKYPKAKRIWIEYDMLRHSGPVGIALTRDDNIATWKYLKREAARIIAVPKEQAPETLNSECNFCVRKTRCNTLQKNILAGGSFSFSDAASAIDVRAQLEYQAKAVRSALDELDRQIIAYAKEKDEFEWIGDSHRMSISVNETRAVDGERISHILGADLMAKYGKVGFNVTTVDKLLKGDEITEDQKRQLRSVIYKKQGEPRIKTKPNNPIDDE